MRIGYVTTQDPIMVGLQPLEEVNQFTYLGSILSTNRKVSGLIPSSSRPHIKIALGKIQNTQLIVYYR